MCPGTFLILIVILNGSLVLSCSPMIDREMKTVGSAWSLRYARIWDTNSSLLGLLHKTFREANVNVLYSGQMPQPLRCAERWHWKQQRSYIVEVVVNS